MLRLRVKEIAQQQGLGQGKLARMADVDIKTLARIYKNPYAEVSTVTLEKLARALAFPLRKSLKKSTRLRSRPALLKTTTLIKTNFNIP